MIREYRKHLRLTQREMAEIIGISEQSYWNKENGRRNFTDEEKLKIRDFLRQYVPEVTIDHIFFKQTVAKRMEEKTKLELF